MCGFIQHTHALDENLQKFQKLGSAVNEYDHFSGELLSENHIQKDITEIIVEDLW